MPKRSAALLLYRAATDGTIEVLLVHPGGPFWARKDEAAWSIPKGEYDADEHPIDAARREFSEETGAPAPLPSQLIELGEVKQPGGKRVIAWAAEGDFDERDLTSNTFEMEWPRGSGRLVEFPEVDRAGWFSIDAARSKIHRGQASFLDLLLDGLGAWRTTSWPEDESTR